MARRRKSIDDIERQSRKIMMSAYRQYGSSDRQRSIRDKTKATRERYTSNIFKHFGSDTISPSQVRQKVTRRVYMGLGNANG